MKMFSVRRLSTVWGGRLFQRFVKCSESSTGYQTLLQLQTLRKHFTGLNNITSCHPSLYRIVAGIPGQFIMMKTTCRLCHNQRSMISVQQKKFFCQSAHLAYSSWSSRVMMAVRSDQRSPSVSAPTASSRPAIAAYLSSVFGGALRVRFEVYLDINGG